MAVTDVGRGCSQTAGGRFILLNMKAQCTLGLEIYQ